MPSSAPFSLLIQIPIFRGLSEAEVKTMLAIADDTRVAKGEAIFKEGDRGDGVYVVMEGGVEITKQDREGKATPLARYGDGTAIGEMSLINGDAPRTATAVATSDTKLLKITGAQFSKLIARNDVAALKIVLNLAQVMSRRLQMMSERFVAQADQQPKKKEELAEFQRILTNWQF